MASTVDLHLHTTASDGHYSPAQIVAMAQARHVRDISITDHDTVAGVAEALSACRGSIVRVIPGVEINALQRQTELHILGYYIDPCDPALLKTLAHLRRSRQDRAERMARKLAKLGLPVDLSRVKRSSDAGTIGRPHLAEALVRKGYVGSVSEAFERYIGRGAPAYVERFRLSPDDAIRIVIEVGGVPVLAHPLNVMRLLPELVKSGLAGLEAYYPGYSASQSAWLMRQGQVLGLVATGGSDFHGEARAPHVGLGGVEVPRSAVSALRSYSTGRPSVPVRATGDG